MTSTSDSLIEEFWEWFKHNELTYRKIWDDKNSDLIDDILHRLTKIQRGLAVEFEKHEGIYVMTISARGIEQYFDAVQNIVNKACSLNSWKFFAFRQPYSPQQLENFYLTIGDNTFDPKLIMFLPIEEDGKLYVQIFAVEITDETKDEIGNGCLMLLDNIIGEYDCVKKIEAFEFYNLNEASEFKDELRPLIEMTQFLKSYYNQDF